MLGNYVIKPWERKDKKSLRNDYVISFANWVKAALKEKKYFKGARSWKSVYKSRAVFRTQSSIYDGTFLRNCQLFLEKFLLSAIFAKSFIIEFNWVLNMPLKRLKLSR